MAAEDLATVIDRMIEERTTLAVGPIEAGRRLCPENPLSPATIARLVRDGVLARVPHTTRLCIPVDDLHRFAQSGMSVERETGSIVAMSRGGGGHAK